MREVRKQEPLSKDITTVSRLFMEWLGSNPKRYVVHKEWLNEPTIKKAHRNRSNLKGFRMERKWNFFYLVATFTLIFIYFTSGYSFIKKYPQQLENNSCPWMACGTARSLFGLNLPKSPFIEIIITDKWAFVC